MPVLKPDQITMEEMQRVITCYDAAQAHLLMGRLNNEGIECFLTNENITSIMPHYNSMLGAGIQIFVKETDFEVAREVLKDEIEPKQEVISCPYCGSQNVTIRERQGGWNILNMIISILIALPFSPVRQKYYCKNCGETFK